MTAAANGIATRFDVQTIKSAASGRALELLTELANIPANLLDGRNHPCPWCDGTDRFSLVDDQAGAVLCRHCFASKNGDFIAAIRKSRGCSFPEALGLCGDYLGLTHSPGTRGSRPQVDVLAEVCRAKNMPIEYAEAYGGRNAKWGRDAVAEFPMFGPDGQQCSAYAIYFDDGSGFDRDNVSHLDGRNRSSKNGKHPTGLFLTCDADRKPILPAKGERWAIVEGIKDAAALAAFSDSHGEMFDGVAGLPGSYLPEKFSELFRSVKVTIVPDVDENGVGDEGCQKTAAVLAGVAESLHRVSLPIDKGDVRDVLHQPDGEGQLLLSIQEATRIGSDGEPREPLPRFTLTELTAEYPKLNPPVVNGLFRLGETVNIIAPPKVGKSWLAYDLALSVITESWWLAAFDTTAGDVLLIDNELHPATIAQRIPRVAKAKAIELAAFADRLEVWPLRGRLASIEDVAAECEAVEPGRFSCIVADAKYRFAIDGASENDNAAEARFYNQVDQIALNTGSAVVLVHHASKGSQSDKRVTDVGAGAGAQSRAADCHVVLREHEESGVYVMEAAVRSFPPASPVALRWEYPLWLPCPQGSVDVNKLAGRGTAGDQRQAEKDAEGRSDVIKAIAGGNITRRQIREATGFSSDRVNRLVAQLNKRGDIETDQVEVKGNKCDQFSITQKEHF